MTSNNLLQKLAAAALIAMGVYLIYNPLVAGALAFWVWTSWRFLEPNWPWIGIGALSVLGGAALVYGGVCLWIGCWLFLRRRSQDA